MSVFSRAIAGQGNDTTDFAICEGCGAAVFGETCSFCGFDLEPQFVGTFNMEDADRLNGQIDFELKGTGHEWNDREEGEGDLSPYVVDEDASTIRMWKEKPKGAPDLVDLANFTAKIVTEIVYPDHIKEDRGRVDGAAGSFREYEIELKLASGRTTRVVIDAREFASLKWATDVSSEAIISPGRDTKDHVRYVIQRVSQGQTKVEIVHQRTGWGEYEGRQYYLTASGGIDANGLDTTLRTKLDNRMSGYRLPDPAEATAEEIKAAVRASLEIVNMGVDCTPLDNILLPGLGAVYRAPLAPTPMTLWYAGITGCFKSQVCSIMQQHFGAMMTDKALPAQWDDTANSLEYVSYHGRDALYVVDDYKPPRDRSLQMPYVTNAERFLRAQGNLQGRQRMTKDLQLRAAYNPSGFALSSAEDLPVTESIVGRLYVVRMAKGQISSAELTKRQKQGLKGQFALAMAAYLRWLAAHPELRGPDAVTSYIADMRSVAGFQGRSEMHSRLGDNAIQLSLGMATFLRFAREIGVLTDTEVSAWWTRTWKALHHNVNRQASTTTSQDPVRRVWELLRVELAAGKAHIAGHNNAPIAFGDEYTEQSLGWVQSATTGLGEPVRRPGGIRAGWINMQGEELYLDATAIEQLLGGKINFTLPQMIEHLAERNYLKRHDPKRGHKVRVRGCDSNSQRDVLVVDPYLLIGDGEEEAEDGDVVQQVTVPPLPALDIGASTAAVANLQMDVIDMAATAVARARGVSMDVARARVAISNSGANEFAKAAEAEATKATAAAASLTVH